MANESARGLRGWVYAVAFAICLLLILSASERFSKAKRPGYYHDPRTSTISVSTTPKWIPKIATESIPLGIEPLLESADNTAWLNYRSASASSIAMLDPPSGARLSAPIAVYNVADPFLEAIQQRRSPSALAEQAAQASQTFATIVSVTRTVESIPTDSSNLDINFRDSTFGVNPSLSPRYETSAIRKGKGWPVSPSLVREIEILRRTSASNSEVELWLDSLCSNCDLLQTLDLNDDHSIATLDVLHGLADKAVSLGNDIASNDSALAREVAQLAYAIERRVSVWSAVARCVNRDRAHFVSVRKHEFDSSILLESIQNVEKSLRATGDTKSWETYLMLDSLKGLAAGHVTGRQGQVDLVRQFLGRVTDTRVSESQRRVLISSEVHKLADQLHPISIGPVNYQKILEDIETLESDPVHRCSVSLADAMQSLRFSEHPEQASVSQAIGMHYRNANLRLAVSEDFINRMMPVPSVTEKPVRQKILGADTRGTSHVATRLKADFVADEAAWNIGLNLIGDISSDTKSSRHGAAFYNSSIASVNAIRSVRISTSGLEINGRTATVESNESLKRFSTDWDKLPILGDMVRQFVHNEFVKARPVAKRIMQKTIAQQTDAEFDTQLQSKISSAQAQFEKRLIGPLQTLDLHPMVVDMQTTDTRLVVRYRVASNEQLSAYTPRPVAPSDSQLSLQIHQSTFNNMAGQVVAGDRPWTMQDLSDKIADLLQQPQQLIDEEAAQDVTIRFNEARPITVEFEDNRMWLTLRVASLEQPGRIHLKNFTIRTSYLPTVDGLKAELTRDGVISVDGQRLAIRDKVPLRAIFSRVFSNRSTIPMVSDELLKDPRATGLAVSQLELRDGWLGIAVSESESPHVALVKAQQEMITR